jgi:DNA helicase II / ATP-dependent DNA helicase PcrA
MKVFDLGLRILSNPFDQLHFIEITRMIKIDFDIEFEQFKDGLEKLKNLHKHIPDDFKSNFTLLISSWEILNDNNRLQFREALKIVEIHANSCEDEERQEILSDIKLYEELWSIYAKSTSSELKSLQHFKTQIALGIIAHSQDETGITLSTIHLSKGLEFDSVFIIGVNQGSLPYYKAVQTGGRTLEEEKNIFYVAVTRAERSLYVTYPQNRFMPWNKDVLKKQSSSIYLEGLENCLV